jgi:hypothetical protein
MAAPRAPVTSRWALRPRRYRTGNTESGQSSRNATSGIVTPMATPRRTSLGASTPSAIRPVATSAMTTAMASLASCRRRPFGIRA